MAMDHCIRRAQQSMTPMILILPNQPNQPTLANTADLSLASASQANFPDALLTNGRVPSRLKHGGGLDRVFESVQSCDTALRPHTKHYESNRPAFPLRRLRPRCRRSEEHTSELQSRGLISY